MVCQKLSAPLLIPHVPREVVFLVQAQHSQMFNKRLGFQKIAEPVEMKSAYKS